jgi:hypothetical protein
MWLMLLGLIVIAIVACLLMPEVRFVVGVTAAAIIASIVIYIAADVARSFYGLYQDNLATKRIAVSEVTLDDLQLTGTSTADYRLTGTVHNHSTTYTLGDVRFGLLLEDCGPTGCRTEGTGHAEVIHSVRPNQAATFSTQIVMLAPLLPPVYQRRITYRVFTTVGGGR